MITTEEGWGMESDVMVKTDVTVPGVPHFLINASGGSAYLLSAISDTALRKIGAQWTRRLLELAREQRLAADEEG